MIRDLQPTPAAEASRASKAKIWIRRLDVSEVPDLLTLGKPSDTNSPVWSDCIAQYRKMLDKRDAWFGGVTLDELTSLVRDGWPEGGARAIALADSFADKVPEPVSVKRRRQWADAGDELDRDRLYNGQLDTAWRRTTRKHGKAPQTLSIVLPWGDNCHTSQDEMFWAPAAAIALTDLLERAGYAVDLRGAFVSCMSRGGRHYAAVEVTVKAAGEILRPNSVAAIFAHAGAFRWYGIPALAGTPNAVDSSFGFAFDPKEAMTLLVDAKLTDPAHIVFPRVYSREAAVKAIQDVLTDLEAGNLALLDS